MRSQARWLSVSAQPTHTSKPVGDKAAAAVIAKALGAYPVEQSTAYAGAVTVVIGADFK